MDRRIDGQNIYYLVGHTRANIFVNGSGLPSAALVTPAANSIVKDYSQKVISAPQSSAVRMRTIPNSNLNDRKRAVLKIHKENMQMVSKLANMKARQEILVPFDKTNIFSTVAGQFRSRSAASANRTYRRAGQSADKTQEAPGKDHQTISGNLISYRYLQETRSSDSRQKAILNEISAYSV